MLYVERTDEEIVAAMEEHWVAKSSNPDEKSIFIGCREFSIREYVEELKKNKEFAKGQLEGFRGVALIKNLDPLTLFGSSSKS